MKELNHRLYIWKRRLKDIRTQERQALKKQNYLYVSKHQLQAEVLQSCINDLELILKELV